MLCFLSRVGAAYNTSVALQKRRNWLRLSHSERTRTDNGAMAKKWVEGRERDWIPRCALISQPRRIMTSPPSCFSPPLISLHIFRLGSRGGYVMFKIWSVASWAVYSLLHFIGKDESVSPSYWSAMNSACGLIWNYKVDSTLPAQLNSILRISNLSLSIVRLCEFSLMDKTHAT